jgi:hypothetical protein
MKFNEFLAHAKKRNGVPLDTLAKEVGAHMVLYPEADIAALKAKGIPAVQCPAQTKGITCKECRLCSRDREAVVIFEVHGNNKGKARRVIQIKRAQ